MKFPLIVFLVFLLSPFFLLAQPHGPAASTAAAGSLPPAEDHAHHPHHDCIELFVGETVMGESSHQLLTIGLDYEHRFRFWHDRFGLGLLVDHELSHGEVGGDWLISPAVMVHPFGSAFKLFAGGGLCLRGHHYTQLLRAGAGYEIFLGEHLLLAPTWGIDYTPDHTALVYGLTVGFGN